MVTCSSNHSLDLYLSKSLGHLDKNNVITDMQSKIECLDRNVKEKVDLLETTFKVMSMRVQMIEAKLV